MTTVLADAKAGVMVSDSCLTDKDRIWSGPKIFRVRGHLLGFAGDVAERAHFLEWFKKGAVAEEAMSFKHSSALVMSPDGKLVVYEGDALPETVTSGREAIGTGGKAAIAAYDALGWENPRRAVLIATRHDAASRAPVRVKKL